MIRRPRRGAEPGPDAPGGPPPAASDDDLISFRPMGRDDLPQLGAWLEQPHVAEWWGDPPDASETVAAVEAKYLPRIQGEHHVSPWIMEVDGRAVGFIQWYLVRDDPDWWPGVDVPADTAAVDLAIGDGDLLGKGHGRRLLVEFIHHVLRHDAPEVRQVWIDPNPRNERACRSYLAAGFRDTGIVLPDPDQPGERRRLMRLLLSEPFPR